MQVNASSGSMPLSTDVQAQSKADTGETKNGSSFADLMKSMANGMNGTEARPAPRPGRPRPVKPPKPEGGPTLPPRCGTPPPPQPPTPPPMPQPMPICIFPPPKPEPRPLPIPLPKPDPRYLGPPIRIDDPIRPTPTDTPIGWPKGPMPVDTYLLPGGGMGARGPFPIEDPAPVPPDEM
jgi:hypothetical protein